MGSAQLSRSFARVAETVKGRGSPEFTAANVGTRQLGADMDPVLSLKEAIEAYRAGRMGRLDPTH